MRCLHSDHHKSLLLACPSLWTLLTLSLFVNLEQHPRGPNAAPPSLPVPPELQAIWQCNAAEALQQLALFPAGRDAMVKQPAVRKALAEVAEHGTTPQAQHHAHGALLALSDKELQHVEGQGHVMLSCEACIPPVFCSAA